ncbi:hypothetical protein GCM10008015_30060 [Flavobacterium palustre]|uniref:Lipoprotein n=1 Tax=Flavobacterium palustre TaxID=1476463 RepID=A0ABQ1HS20_9FLAO|nr:hypothetical protein [Flavobacterium palustre]GGA87394.1 hypothetical protein GCM10008015_30060 [Flavobacterium palustre]
MNKFIWILATLLLATSCIDNRKSWLQEYKKTKCAWLSTKEKVRLESIQNSRQLNPELISINQKITRIIKPIQSEIALLNHRINEINIKYLNKSRKISEAHEHIYGHISTPEFEKELEQNDNNNIREITPLKNKIAFLQSKLNQDATYLYLIAEQNKIKAKIAVITTAVKDKHQVTFDSLQKELDRQNYDYNYILQKLDRNERQKFSNEKARIKQKPCK